MKERGSVGEFGARRADMAAEQPNPRAPPVPTDSRLPTLVAFRGDKPGFCSTKRCNLVERESDCWEVPAKCFLNGIGNCSLMVCMQGEAGGLAGSGRKEGGKPQR